MNKKKVIKNIANKCDIDQSKVKSALEALQEVSLEALKDNKTVHIPNFITLKTSDVTEKRYFSFKGESHTIPAHKTIRASVSPKYKDMLREKEKGFASLSFRQKLEGALFVITLVSAAVYFLG